MQKRQVDRLASLPQGVCDPVALRFQLRDGRTDLTGMTLEDGDLLLGFGDRGIAFALGVLGGLRTDRLACGMGGLEDPLGLRADRGEGRGGVTGGFRGRSLFGSRLLGLGLFFLGLFLGRCRSGGREACIGEGTFFGRRAGRKVAAA